MPTASPAVGERPTGSPLWRRLSLLALVMMFVGLLTPATASAAPKDLAQLPDNLRKYVVDSAGWVSSPWMTSAACRDQGGDWSSYVQSVTKDSADLLAFFQPDIGGQDAKAEQRKQALLAGYRDVAAQVKVPSGYCVNDVKQWAGASGADPSGRPFGFVWGNDRQHATQYSCGDSAQLGAEKAPCNAFYVSCAGATGPDKNRCDAWNKFSDSYVSAVSAMRTKVLNDNRGQNGNDTETRIKSPSEVMDDLATWVTEHGMKQLVTFIVEGVTKLWGTFLDIAVEYTTPNIQGKGFASVYNLVAGIALALAFLGFIVTMAMSYKRGYLQYSIIGAIKASVGVTLAGVGAILMLQLADDCTRALAKAGGDLAKQADWTGSIAKVNPLVAVLLGVLIALFLLIAIVFLIAIGPVVLMWALFGSIAAAGQVHPATAGWLPKWTARLTALCWVKFFMVAVMLLIIALVLPIGQGSDAVRQLVDVVQGFVLAALLVTTPWLLWELVDFASERVGGSGSGGPAAQAAGGSSRRVGKAAGKATGAVGGAVGGAAATMMANASDLANKMRGKGGSGGGSGGGKPANNASVAPRPPEESKSKSPGGGSGGGTASPKTATSPSAAGTGKTAPSGPQSPPSAPLPKSGASVAPPLAGTGVTPPKRGGGETGSGGLSGPKPPRIPRA